MPTKVITENKIISGKDSPAGKLKNSIKDTAVKVVMKKIGRIIFSKKVCFDDN
jgi:hypothetical protein